ncbi:MAG: ATP-binding cassette domain-containing protein, partial [Planctomyces sp.]
LLEGGIELSDSVVEVMDSIGKSKLALPILTAPVEVTESRSDPGRLEGAISADDIVFRYRDEGPPVLNHVTFRAAPGEFVAIVGPSGCGKSTLLRLILGFETPQSGTISFDGSDLAALDIVAVRRQIGVVLQNSRISASTILEFITAGIRMTLAEAWELAEAAGLAEDIRAMPMGMHTVISEGGGGFSGGQRQRLMIARALASKARILLFDEATSALDNQTQQIVSDSIRRRHVTRITVAHRLSTIREADRIYVLERGSVVQVGTFEELSREPGLFTKMMERQIA